MEKCVCGKELKTPRGLKIHWKACDVYKAQGEASDPAKAPGPGPEPKGASEPPVGPPAESGDALPSTFSPPVEIEPPKEVPVGSEIIMQGKVWMKEPREGYKGVPVDNIRVIVTARQVVADGIWLVCSAEGSDVIIAAAEHEVLDPDKKEYTISKLAVVEDAQNPAQDLAAKMEAEKVEREKREAEMAKERDGFGKAVTKYAADRDAKLVAAKVFSKTDKANRPMIEDYTRKYGSESASGKEDFQVLDFGYNVHIVRTPGVPSTEYDEKALVEWLLQSGHNDCIRMLPDLNMWANLKEAGKVPPEVIAALEKPVEGEDRFSLNVKKDKDAK